MARAIASNALTVGILVLLALASALVWGRREYAGVGPLTEPICFLVPSGASMNSVSRRLDEQGAISNPSVFRMGAEYSERADKLKAGSYLIPEGASMDSILGVLTTSGRSTCGTEINYRIGVAEADMIVRELDPATENYVELANFVPGVDPEPEGLEAQLSAPSTRFRVTLAEGVTSWQVVESLKAAPFLAGEIAAVPPEGHLAPDSYETRRGGDRAAILEQMQQRQEAILAELWAARQPDLPLETPEEALTLASIVEKETGVAEERDLVASVFVNRLNQGMRLQTDPTVIYGVTEGRSVLGRGLRQSELRQATPYNTYVIQGLPPGPIANPGRNAIFAALNPATTDYLFFVADGTGGHAFASTLGEHNINVAKWREIEAQRANQ
ncbi:endolytic transglycosylase MltG [Tropicimonas sp. IMCC6043]|uniref:endolytic transglycosylase MltG n=1 Tax=Tropicimonas sp. IMCC6043 TaxID=2510645 RepID=UPI00101B785B|nr:endolytic transglycosylase MltG [Tropicimonas sp. IMCC6043]RYH11189.1 endolytic transglycosylase MltG [Tropicimonas sp. IMCC6043]